MDQAIMEKCRESAKNISLLIGVFFIYAIKICF